MAIGSVSGSTELVQSHHRHIHKAGTPVTKKDPASSNDVPGPATSSTDKALAANQQQAVVTPTPSTSSTTAPTEAQTQPASAATSQPSTASSSIPTATGLGTLADKKV